MLGERFKSATYSPATEDTFLYETAGLPRAIVRRPLLSVMDSTVPIWSPRKRRQTRGMLQT
jgi:hypothetical protein